MKLTEIKISFMIKCDSNVANRCVRPCGDLSQRKKERKKEKG